MDDVTAFDKLRSAMGSYRLSRSNERELQDSIEELLVAEAIPFEREAELAPSDRPDFMVESCAVEVKTKGSATEVLRQLLRYAGHDRVDRLMLITTRSSHVHIQPVLLGKPLFVFYLSPL